MSEKITGVDFKSNEDENQDRSVTTRDTEASQLSMGENVSGCTAEETEVTSEVSNNQSDNDVNFQLRAASPSFNSDSSENSVVTDEGKRENSPATALKTDTVAEKSEEQQLGGVPATEDDPFIQSVKYLEKHQILRLFQVRLRSTGSEDDKINFHLFQVLTYTNVTETIIRQNKIFMSPN